jgi:lipopolysaccharide biosynthesis glycosyltransferase
MEVLCACDRRYLPHAATMLCSLLEHNDVSRIHLFYSSIAKQELAKLESCVASYGSKLTSYEMVPTDFEALRTDKWASAAVYYRLLAPRLLPAELDKVLYLDSDIIVRRSLANLWNTDISDHALAAVSNYEDDARKALGLPEGTKYFNSGVLLINLRFWRENKIVEHAISFIKSNPGKVQYWDQDALNATLIDQWVELPIIWNWQLFQRASEPGAKLEPAVVHYVTGDKPWHWSNEHPLKQEYRKYRRKTPWAQYQLEGRPNLPRRIRHSLRGVARIVLPSGLRAWLRARLSSHT